MARPKPPLDVLILEDEAIIAMDLETMVEASGHRVMATADRLPEVEALDDEDAPDLALIDIHLADDVSGLDVGRYIKNRWPAAMVIFVTANTREVPSDFAGAEGVIAKPFSKSGMMSALKYLEEAICDPPPKVPNPMSFTAAPAFQAAMHET